MIDLDPRRLLVNAAVCVAALAVAALFGAGLTALHYREALARSDEHATTMQASNQGLQQALRDTSLRLEAIGREDEARRRQAQEAVAAADQTAKRYERQAQALLAKHPPPGADLCEAARQAFATELKLERMQ